MARFLEKRDSIGKKWYACCRQCFFIKKLAHVHKLVPATCILNVKIFFSYVGKVVKFFYGTWKCPSTRLTRSWVHYQMLTYEKYMGSAPQAENILKLVLQQTFPTDSKYWVRFTVHKLQAIYKMLQIPQMDFAPPRCSSIGGFLQKVNLVLRSSSVFGHIKQLTSQINKCYSQIRL